MKIHRPLQCGLLVSALILTFCLPGCEGIDRRHDPRVLDLQPPAEDSGYASGQGTAELANFPDLVEQMLANRETLLSVRQLYFDQLIQLERAYLQAGDTIKANWARRQRERLEEVDVEPYPYLTAAPPEHGVEVAPEEEITEANRIFSEALTLLNEFRGIPAAGFLELNQRKAREALKLFKRVLHDHPKSDKVDDCAYYCGEIYKEYLRDDDPDNELAIRYYKWAYTLDPATPHPTRFQCAVVYDFRRHDRVRALELYNQVMETEEDGNLSNMRFAATRIEQLTDDDFSPIRPRLDRPTVTRAPEDAGDPDTAP